MSVTPGTVVPVRLSAKLSNIASQLRSVKAEMLGHAPEMVPRVQLVIDICDDLDADCMTKLRLHEALRDA
jgi:hypothetical protein